MNNLVTEELEALIKTFESLNKKYIELVEGHDNDCDNINSHDNDQTDESNEISSESMMFINSFGSLESTHLSLHPLQSIKFMCQLCDENEVAVRFLPCNHELCCVECGSL